jgi:dienelactone hydrolase
MRELEAAAKSKNAPLQLVVYPDAQHAFNIKGQTYRGDDTADAWRRTAEMLAQYHWPSTKQ